MCWNHRCIVEPQVCAGPHTWNANSHSSNSLLPPASEDSLTCYFRGQLFQGKQDVTSSNLLLNGDLFVQKRHSLGSWEQVDSFTPRKANRLGGMPLTLGGPREQFCFNRSVLSHCRKLAPKDTTSLSSPMSKSGGSVLEKHVPTILLLINGRLWGYVLI